MVGGRAAALRAGLRSAVAALRRATVGIVPESPLRQAPAMSMDTEWQKHYALLLGIGSPWEVKTVELKLGEKQVEIELGWQWGQERQGPGMRPGLLDPRLRAGAHLAALGHDAVYHVASRPDAARGLSGARDQDHEGAVGGAAWSFHGVV